MARAREDFVGNRIALIGAVLYLLEWVVIPAAPSVPTDSLGKDPATVFATYTDRPGIIGLLSGWCAFVLLGRILFIAGVKGALRGHPRQQPLVDFALAAMAISITLELVVQGIVAGTSWYAVNGGSPDVVSGLDTITAVLWPSILAPLGASVIAAAIAQRQAHILAGWIPWVGLVGGAVMVLGGVLGAAGLGAEGFLHNLSGALSIGIPLFWIWMLASAIVIFRHRPRRGADADTAVVAG